MFNGAEKNDHPRHPDTDRRVSRDWMQFAHNLTQVLPRLEEDQFLPMAETILGRKDPSMAALGLSLHMRHQLRAASRNEAITASSTARRTV